MGQNLNPQNKRIIQAQFIKIYEMLFITGNFFESSVRAMAVRRTDNTFFNFKHVK